MITLVIFGLLYFVPVVGALPPFSREVENVTICELAKHPSKYAGHLVATRAWVGGRRDTSLLDIKPSQDCPPGIVILVLPGNIEPTPSFALVEDEIYAQYSKALRGRTHIEATFEGRFDYAPNRNSFGYKRRAKMRIVLRRVSSLAVYPTARLDR
jgi:hypothetical protein